MVGDSLWQTGTSTYNSSNYNYSYGVGYTYQADAQRPSSQNGGTASTIKGELDNWYSTNIAGNRLDDKVVSTAGFCNDRNTASESNWVASGTRFDYAAYERLDTNKTPTLECSNTNDIYTTKIGLITADEVSMAGGVWGNASNTSYYLYTGQYYWTMSPSYYSGFAYVFRVGLYGYLGYYNVAYAMGVRPVLNLSADITLTGTGTMSDPYVVVWFILLILLIIIFDQSIIKIIMFEIPYYVWARRKEIITKIGSTLFSGVILK